MTALKLALPAVATSVSLAREALDRLEGSVAAGRLDDLRLVVSELVTNSVRHAGLRSDDRILVSIVARPGKVIVEIHDPGPGFELPSAPATMYQDSGWGLFLVSQLADRWGVSSDRGGTTVRLEFAT